MDACGNRAPGPRRASAGWVPSTSSTSIPQLAYVDNLAACEGLLARRVALDERLSHVARDPEFWPLVRRLRAFRGIDTLSALVIVLGVGDFQRFQRAVQLGSWLGLVPSRQQSGETDTHGPITKTGPRMGDGGVVG